MEKDWNEEWENAKRRFHLKQAMRMRFRNLWRGVKPFVEEFIIYSFIALIFFGGYYVFERNPPSSDEALNNQLNSQIRNIVNTFLLCVFGLFSFHVIFSMIDKLFIKKIFYRQFKRIRLLKAQSKSAQDGKATKKEDNAENEPKKKTKS